MTLLTSATYCEVMCSFYESEQRNFSIAVPVVWNSLPPHLRSSSIGLSRQQFQARLKPHLSRKPIQRRTTS